MPHSLTERLSVTVIRWNHSTRMGRLRNRMGKHLALAGRGASPAMWDIFIHQHPVTAWAWGLTRRPLLSAGFTGWVAGL